MSRKKLAIVGSRSFTEHLVGYIETDKIIKSEEGRESVTSMIMGCKEMGNLITNMIQAED